MEDVCDLPPSDGPAEVCVLPVAVDEPVGVLVKVELPPVPGRVDKD